MVGVRMSALTEEEIYAELQIYANCIAYNPTPSGRSNRAYRIVQILQDKKYVEPLRPFFGLYKITDKGKRALNMVLK